MAQPLTITYKKIGDVSIDLDIWFPTEAQTTGKSVPAMVWFHGGGGFAGDKSRSVNQWLPVWIKDMITKDNQWIMIIPNYRLLVPTTGHDIVEDIKDMFKFITDTMVSKPIGDTLFTVDPKRIVTGGESFGAYCARLAALYAVPKPKAIFSQYGMGGDFLIPWYLAGRSSSINLPMAFNAPLFPLPHSTYEDMLTSKEVISGIGMGMTDKGEPYSDRQNLLAYTFQLAEYLDCLTGIKGLSKTISQKVSDNDDGTYGIPSDASRLFPQLHLDSSFPPTFLLHWVGDTVVSVDESRKTAEQLKALGVDYEYLELPGGEHGFDFETKAEDGDERYVILKRSGEWLKEKLAM